MLARAVYRNVSFFRVLPLDGEREVMRVSAVRARGGESYRVIAFSPGVGSIAYVRNRGRASEVSKDRTISRRWIAKGLVDPLCQEVADRSPMATGTIQYGTCPARRLIPLKR